MENRIIDIYNNKIIRGCKKDIFYLIYEKLCPQQYQSEDHELIVT